MHAESVRLEHLIQGSSISNKNELKYHKNNVWVKTNSMRISCTMKHLVLCKIKSSTYVGLHILLAIEIIHVSPLLHNIRVLSQKFNSYSLITITYIFYLIVLIIHFPILNL